MRIKVDVPLLRTEHLRSLRGYCIYGGGGGEHTVVTLSKYSSYCTDVFIISQKGERTDICRRPETKSVNFRELGENRLFVLFSYFRTLCNAYGIHNSLPIPCSQILNDILYRYTFFFISNYHFWVQPQLALKLGKLKLKVAWNFLSFWVIVCLSSHILETKEIIGFQAVSASKDA